MKKETWLATFGYIVSVAMLLSFLYWFLKNEGFSEEKFLIASIFVLILAAGWGSIISSHILAPKVKQDENLSHLSSEILHELNIPLSTIQANSALIKKRTQDERMLKRLARIDNASFRLERLYKELVYSIKKEIHPIEKETFLLADILRERVEVFQTFGRNPFCLELENLTLYADKIGFEKMLDNLVMNAMKYSEKEKEIALVCDETTLLIKDQGIGMDETQLLRIYERYYQADGKHQGEGIGLALVKAYCDASNIEITIRSKLGEGTIIALSLEKIVKF